MEDCQGTDQEAPLPGRPGDISYTQDFLDIIGDLACEAPEIKPYTPVKPKDFENLAALQISPCKTNGDTLLSKIEASFLRVGHPCLTNWLDTVCVESAISFTQICQLLAPVRHWNVKCGQCPLLEELARGLEDNLHIKMKLGNADETAMTQRTKALVDIWYHACQTKAGVPNERPMPALFILPDVPEQGLEQHQEGKHRLVASFITQVNTPIGTDTCHFIRWDHNTWKIASGKIENNTDGPLGEELWDLSRTCSVLDRRPPAHWIFEGGEDDQCCLTKGKSYSGLSDLFQGAQHGTSLVLKGHAEVTHASVAAIVMTFLIYGEPNPHPFLFNKALSLLQSGNQGEPFALLNDGEEMWRNLAIFLKLLCTRKTVQDCRQGRFVNSKAIGLINLGDFMHESHAEWQRVVRTERHAILINWEKGQTIETIEILTEWKFTVDTTEDYFPVLCVGTQGSRPWLTLTSSKHVVGKLAPPPDEGWAGGQPRPENSG